MAVTDYTVLRLTGVLNIEHLSFLELHVGVNAHGWAIVEGEAGENALAQLSEATAGREQQILTLDETGNEKCLFAGVISEAELMDAGGYRCFHIELLSGTCQMDQAIRSRSFQNVSQTYSQIAKQVIAEYPGGAAIISVGEDLIIERPIIQYRETDWAFLMRLASHCGGVVVPETHRGLPRLWFGFPDRSFTCQFPEDSYTSGISQRYYELGGSAAGFKKEDFFYYDVQSTQLCDLGWYTIFKGQPFLISEKYAKLEYGELIFTYRLGRPGLGWGKKFYNEKISGMTLLGEVVETARETLKLKLDIDRCWNPGGPYPYTWRPETGNFMYCMPKVGTRVSLYFPSYDEKAAIAVNCIRTNGGSCERMRDPSRRSFVTEHGKEMNLYPDEMSLIAGSEGKIRLSDKDGIEIGSQKPVIIFGREVVRFEAPKVAFLAPLGEIGMAKKSDFATDAVDSGFIVSNQYDFLAKSYTHMEGWDCRDFDPYSDAPPEGNFLLAIAGNVLAGLAAVALVTAALAITIGTGGIAGAIVAGACVTGVVAVGAQAYSDIKNGRTGSMGDYFSLGWQAAQIGAVVGAISGLISCAVFSIGTTIAVAHGATALGLGGTMVCAGFSGGLTSIATQLLFNQGEIDWSKVGWSSLICTVTAGTCYALRNFRFHIDIDNGDVRGVAFDRNTGYGNAFYRMGDGSAANVPFRVEFTGIGYRCTLGTGYQYIPGQGFYPYNWTWPGTSLVPTLGGSWIPGTGVTALPGSNILALPESGIPALTEGSALVLPGGSSPVLPGDSALILPSSLVPTLPGNGILPLPSVSIPALAGSSALVLPGNIVPTLSSNTIPVVVGSIPPVLPKGIIPNLTDKSIPVMAESRVSGSVGGSSGEILPPKDPPPKDPPPKDPPPQEPEKPVAKEGGTTRAIDWEGRTSELAQSSPLSIPADANVTIGAKSGYDQIRFTWKENGLSYEARWHTRTPGAPEGQKNTWVISRTTPGTPTGQRKVTHILVGDTWVPSFEWQDAIAARKNGTATAEQILLLDNGHWPAP